VELEDYWHVATVVGSSTSTLSQITIGNPNGTANYLMNSILKHRASQPFRHFLAIRRCERCEVCYPASKTFLRSRLVPRYARRRDTGPDIRLRVSSPESMRPPACTPANRSRP